MCERQPPLAGWKAKMPGALRTRRCSNTARWMMSSGRAREGGRTSALVGSWRNVGVARVIVSAPYDHFLNGPGHVLLPECRRHASHISDTRPADLDAESGSPY